MLGSALAGLSLSQFEFELYCNYQILTTFSLGLRMGGGQEILVYPQHFIKLGEAKLAY